MSLPKDYPRKIDDIEKISDALNCQVIEVFRGIDDFLAIVKDESIVETIDPNIEKIAELNYQGEINVYQEKRKLEYPNWEDQLDKIYHSGIDAWKADIKVIKDKYPKPS